MCVFVCVCVTFCVFLYRSNYSLHILYSYSTNNPLLNFGAILSDFFFFFDEGGKRTGRFKVTAGNALMY